MRVWLFAAAAAMFFAAPREVAGQAKTTTKSGVYTFEQAQRGRDVYLGQCRSCHTPETHTGPVFNALWNGKLLSELYVYLVDKMPKNNPGSLTEEEYADVTAYLLRMNRLPTGKAELPSDSTKLKSIKIELTTATKSP